MAVEARDPVGNVVRSNIDYRVLAPHRVTDPNGNRSEAIFDTIGFVVGTALQGKAGEAQGDTLADVVADLSPRQLADFPDRSGGDGPRFPGRRHQPDCLRPPALCGDRWSNVYRNAEPRKPMLSVTSHPARFRG